MSQILVFTIENIYNLYENFVSQILVLIIENTVLIYLVYLFNSFLSVKY